MATNTNLRCKVVIKECFKEELSYLASLNYDWSLSNLDFIQQYSTYSRADTIPASTEGLPFLWEEDEQSESFTLSFDEQSRLWSFQCSLKNYDQTIQQFFDNVLALLTEEVLHLEYYVDGISHSFLYTLKDEQIILSEQEGICYEYEW